MRPDQLWEVGWVRFLPLHLVARCYALGIANHGVLGGYMQRREFVTLIGGAAAEWPSRCLNGSTMAPFPHPGRVEGWRAGRPLDRATFPVPSTSHAACGFPALRAPICFTPTLMGPILLGRLSARRVALDRR